MILLKNKKIISQIRVQKREEKENGERGAELKEAGVSCLPRRRCLK